ncbi:toxin-antitoxin system HicB family antitoxin [Sporomusa termitida]|uniref:toxin-antitoxin system HicB family antitoxin n=1 Tax=Sporomusa termitida TaxID=2377 RepID=UPI001FE27094|nr:toxin-antitoxin system HicB family antitoxin [Sporomusa termitida]
MTRGHGSRLSYHFLPLHTTKKAGAKRLRLLMLWPIAIARNKEPGPLRLHETRNLSPCFYQAGSDIPEPEVEEYSGKFNLRIPKSLHKDLVIKAKAENISLNQMATYLLAKGLNAKVKL